MYQLKSPRCLLQPARQNPNPRVVTATTKAVYWAEHHQPRLYSYELTKVYPTNAIIQHSEPAHQVLVCRVPTLSQLYPKTTSFCCPNTQIPEPNTLQDKN